MADKKEVFSKVENGMLTVQVPLDIENAEIVAYGILKAAELGVIRFFNQRRIAEAKAQAALSLLSIKEQGPIIKTVH